MSVREALHPKGLGQTSQFCWSLVLLGEWPVLIDRVEALLTTFSYRLGYKFCYLGPAQLRRDNVMVALSKPYEAKYRTPQRNDPKNPTQLTLNPHGRIVAGFKSRRLRAKWDA